MLTYTRHSWPLNSECSIVCPINCYTENLSWSYSRTPDIHTFWRAFSRGTVSTCFNDLGLSWSRFRKPNPSACGANAVTRCASQANAPSSRPVCSQNKIYNSLNVFEKILEVNISIASMKFLFAIEHANPVCYMVRKIYQKYY